MPEAAGSGASERGQEGTPSGRSGRKVSRGARPGKNAFGSARRRLPKATPGGEQRKKRERTSYSDLVDGPFKVTVGKSGRVTLPASIREELDLDEGVELNVQVDAGELVLTPVMTVPRSYYWVYSPEHRDRLNTAIADADEGRIRPLDEDELIRVLRS
jgi:AbrB family looped-hinge helix DNA binding protein